MPALTSWHLRILYDNFYLGSSGAGASCIGIATGALAVFVKNFRIGILNVPVKLKLDAKISRYNTVASVHVLLSKSEFFYPPICVDPPNEDDNPPRL
jgi:hypothetical protein